MLTEYLLKSQNSLVNPDGMSWSYYLIILQEETSFWQQHLTHVAVQTVVEAQPQVRFS